MKVSKAMIHRAALAERNIVRRVARYEGLCNSKVLIYALSQVENHLIDNLFNNGYEIDYTDDDRFYASLFNAAVEDAKSFHHAVCSGSYFEYDIDRAKHYLIAKDFEKYDQAIKAGRDDPFDIYRTQAAKLHHAFNRIYKRIALETIGL